MHGRIADLRKKAGLTQEALADLVGVDNTAVSHWETGFSRPDLARLAGVAAALGVSVDDLIDGEQAA